MADPTNYQPTPIDTSSVKLPHGLEELTEKIAENAHDVWARGRMAEGWTYGEKRDDDAKKHPDLLPYDQLSDGEKQYDRDTAMESIKAILAMGYRIEPPEHAPAPAPADAPTADSVLMRHFDGTHPKRILALDGGGIKGVMTLGFVERLENKLAQRLYKAGKIANPDDFRLCQYFDLIGGTSTGSIIAGALAMGMKTSDLKKMYLELGSDVFKGDKGTFGMLTQNKRFDKKALEKHLRTIFGEAKLGGPELQTGLCIVAKRADTRSTWPLINHPRGKYYEYNAPLNLRHSIRASTAAPTFFEPQILPTGDVDEKGKLVKGAFMDGGVSMSNNPSLQCFLAAVLKGFPFHWDTGADKLLLVSMGTGHARIRFTMKEVVKFGLLRLVKEIPQMLMDDANWQNQLLMQSFSNSPTCWEIDSEVGDCYEDLIGGQALLHYVRYDAMLEKEYIEELGLPDHAVRAEAMREMSDASNTEGLAKVGEAAALRDIPEADDQFALHIPEHFDTVIV